MGKFVDNIKAIMVLVRIFFITTLSVTLFKTYRAVESKDTFFYSLLTTQAIVFALTFLIDVIFLKNEGKIKTHMKRTWQIALLGLIIISMNMLKLITNTTIPQEYNEIVLLIGIIACAFTIQRISFFKFI